MILEHESHVGTTAPIDWNIQFKGQLGTFAHPDETRIDTARCLTMAAAIQAGFVGKLDQRNHAPERCFQARIFHEVFKIWQAVLNRETPIKRCLLYQSDPADQRTSVKLRGPPYL